jgi:hypothetical protein
MPTSAPPPNWEIRALTEADVPGCESLHERVHGYSRTNELRETLATGSPIVALRGGSVRAYMAVPTFWIANHGVAETEEDMQALLLGAARIVQEPLSFLLPVRHAALFRWCFARRFRKESHRTIAPSHHHIINPLHPVTSRSRASVGFNGVVVLGLSRETSRITPEVTFAKDGCWALRHWRSHERRSPQPEARLGLPVWSAKV